MDRDPDDAFGDMVVDVRETFTLAERLQQLAEIDNDITTLLSLTNETLRPLSSPIAAPGGDSATVPKDFSNPSVINSEVQVAAFRSTMDAFLSTLHAVDVRLKRQIWGLEEAGIISLKESKAAGVSLEPNGVGDIGLLDVGWLNSRSNKVDRDMEAELWLRMRAVLEQLYNSAAETSATDGDNTSRGEDDRTDTGSSQQVS